MWATPSSCEIILLRNTPQAGRPETIRWSPFETKKIETHKMGDASPLFSESFPDRYFPQHHSPHSCDQDPDQDREVGESDGL